MRPGSKKQSPVWNYFNKNNDTKFATCNLCRKVLSYYGSTTNLRQHLNRIHPTIKFQNEPPRNGCETISSANNENGQNLANSSTSTSRNADSDIPFKRPAKQLKLFGSTSGNVLSEQQISKIDASLVKLITKDFQPISIVENEGFLAYTAELQPLYKVPNRRKITQEMLPRYYTEAVEELKNILSEVKNVAVTTHMWTSDSNKSYVTVTVHFIHKNTLYSRVISTKELTVNHTGENIAAHLREIFVEWGISYKIVTVVSDNGANMKNAINEQLHMYHHPCVAHTLNLTVQDVLKCDETLNEVLRKCRALVGHFKHSVNAAYKLKSVQEQLNLPVLKVKQDVPTRWNSCYLMIERLFEIKDALSVTITNLQTSIDFLGPTDWKILKDCLTILKPANTLTSILSGDKYPTMSLVIPFIRGLLLSIMAVKPETEVGEQLKMKFSEYVQRRLGHFEVNRIAAKATFLDPRFKKVGFRIRDNANNAERLVTEELGAIFCRQNQENVDPADTIESSDNQTADSESDIWSHFDRAAAEFKINSTPSSTATIMIKQYLQVPLFDRKKNPLEFWSEYKNLFPEVYELSLKYLCIPCSSVPSERVFSKAGQLTNMRRNRLSPKNLDTIIFLNASL